MDAPDPNEPNFTVKFGRFKSVTTQKKQEIFNKHKSDSTNKATRLWVNNFEEYLIEKGKPANDNIPTDDLPDILYNYYTETCKKKPNAVSGEEEE